MTLFVKLQNMCENWSGIILLGTTIHNEVVIEGKLAMNVPVAPALFRELMSVL